MPRKPLLDDSQGWLKTSRGLFDPQHPFHPRSCGEPACPAFAFQDLVAQARWRDGNELRRGELRASERFLGERWNWSRSRVHRFLEKLEAIGAVGRHPSGGRRPSRIEILGYNDFMPKPKNREQVHKSNRSSNRKLNHNNSGTNGDSPDIRSASRTVSGPASRTTGETKEEVRKTSAGQGKRDYARAKESSERLCPDCLMVEIELGRNRCSRCERLDEDLVADFTHQADDQDGDLPEIPF